MYLKFFMNYKMLYKYKDLSLIFFLNHEGLLRIFRRIYTTDVCTCLYQIQDKRSMPHMKGIFCLLFDLEFNSYDTLCICDFPYHQMVKILPAMQETWVWSLGQEDPLEQGNGYPLQYSCLRKTHGQRSLMGYVHGVTKSDMTKQLTHTHISSGCLLI